MVEDLGMDKIINEPHMLAKQFPKKMGTRFSRFRPHFNPFTRNIHIAFPEPSKSGSKFVENINFVIYTDYSTITPCVGKNEFDSFFGQTVSLITLQNNSIVSSENLEYALDSYELVPSSRAIRNKSLGKSFTIECSEPLMVFQSKE